MSEGRTIGSSELGCTVARNGDRQGVVFRGLRTVGAELVRDDGGPFNIYVPERPLSRASFAPTGAAASRPVQRLKADGCSWCCCCCAISIGASVLLFHRLWA